MTKPKDILKTILFFYIFILPFVFFTKNDFSPFEILKYVGSGLIILSATLFFLFRFFREKSAELKWTAPLALMALILATQTLSYVFSINPYLSFWGDYYLPADSYLSYIVFTLFASLLTQLILTKADVERIVLLLICSCALLTIHGIIQHFGLDFTAWWAHTDMTHAVFASIGQPVGYATVLGMVTPLILVSFLTVRKKHLQLGLGALLFLVYLAMLYSSSRAPIVTNIFISLVVLFYFFKKRFQLHSSRRLVVSIFILLSSHLMFYMEAQGGSVRHKMQEKVLAKGVNARLLIWQDGFKAWQQHPLIGTGPETYAITQRALQSAEMNKYEYWNYYWAKAHNYIIQFLAGTGLLGLLAQLLLIFSMFAAGWKVFTRPQVRAHDPLVLGFAAGFLFMAIANLTAFNLTTTQMYSFLFPTLVGLLLCDFQPRRLIVHLRPAIRVMAAITSLILFVTALVYIFDFWRADIFFHLSIHAQKQGAFLEAIALNDEAIRLNESNPNLYCHKSEILLGLLKKNKSTLDQKAVTEVVNAMDETSRHCTDLGINRHQFILARAMLFGELFYEKIIPDSSIAEAGFELLAKVNPNSPVPYYRLGLLYSISGREPQFIEQMHKAISLKQDYIPAYRDLLLYYYKIKNQTEVNKTVAAVIGTQFYNAEFLPYIKGLMTIAEKNNDEASKALLSDHYEKIKNIGQ